jgi:hypothetical protein
MFGGWNVTEGVWVEQDAELQELSDEPSEPLDWKGNERFEVLRCIGRGGMGAVYEARDRDHGRRVALKTLLHFDAASLLLFKQEFRTLTDVSHPNLVRLHELFASEGERVYFSMELVRGTDFVTHVQRGVPMPRLDESTGGLGGAGHSHARQMQAVALESGHSPVAPSGGGSHSTADFDRLLPALRQLVDGVQALHAAGKLHRDIKPSNVLVGIDGRVVLLDFGVATDLPRIGQDVSLEDTQTVGTARYMAPEQAFGDAPTPAADWYSVGVMLFEALVGAPPFTGSMHDVLQQKNSVDAPAPSDLVDGIPAELDALCRELLSRSPDERPSGRAILRRLGASRPSTRAASSGPPAAEVALIGREAPMRTLADAFDAARGGRCVTVRVGGQAGMGKSALVQDFLDGLVARNEALVLRGRAYERESLPYKAVDSIIDALSRHLAHLDDSEETLPLPADIGALAHLFPVLRRVSQIGQMAEEPLADPGRLRRRAFGALRELLGTLARRRPLILYIDDVHWGDTDSVALLLHLVQPPNAPPILVLLSHREEDAATGAFLTELRARWPPSAEMRDVAVGPLDTADARRLALALLGPGTSHEYLADAVARESAGSPFLVEELARGAAGRFAASHEARVTIEQVVEDRLAELPTDARRAMEIVAVAGRPLPLSTLGDAAGVESPDELVALLAARRFVRPGLRDGREVAEVIHERIRETIVAQLPPPIVREHHGRLARVLLATQGADPESIAIHLLGAGETERGGRFAQKAAEQAAKVLAFDQAARLFRLAIETQAKDSPRVGQLHARLAEVLGWDGRNEEAGRAYVAAAERTAGPDRVALERAASAQLIAAGRIAEGGLMLRRVLASVGVDLPRSPLAAVASLLASKARLRLFGLGFVEREPDQVPAAQRARLDALHVAALGLASVDIILAGCMQARQLVEALSAGDRARIVRAAILYYGSHLATRGGPVSAHERDVHDLMVRLIEKGGSALELAFSRGTYGVGLFLRGRWREAVEVTDAAYVNLPSQQAGMQAQAALYAVYAQAFLGDLDELRRRQARLLADADQRGDLFMSVLLKVSHPVVLVLADDDPDGARVQVREAKARWSQGEFLIQDWQVMRSEVEIELYAGNGAAAWERIERDERALEKSHLLRVQFMRILTRFARGRAAVLSIRATPQRRAARLAEARKLARQLRQERMAWTEPLAAIVTASVKNIEGDRAGTATALREAASFAGAADMALYAAGARHQLGLLLGKGEGADLVREAEERMRDQGIRDPARFASMLVPGVWRDDADRGSRQR